MRSVYVKACSVHAWHIFSGRFPPYVQRNRATFEGKEHEFLRQACQAAAQMVLGHELAHILRGHLVFLREKGMLQDGVLAECGVHHEGGEQMAWRRFLELDADIYGAQFSLADTVVQFSSSSSEQWLTAITAYTIGVRGLFEVLRNPRRPHDAAMVGDYPHPISRAYLAVSHGIARLGDGPLAHLANTGAEAVARQVLLEYEHRELGLPVEDQVLQMFFATEVKYWHAHESMLLPYQLTSAVANRTQAKVGR